MRKILLIIGGLLVLLAISVSPANAQAEPISAGTGDPAVLVVDGVEYQHTKLTGSATHYETPDTNPTSAYTQSSHPFTIREWTGNGSGNLPCEGGIHWILTKNVLTISNCLDIPPTVTTTTVPVTTTTVPTTTTTSTTPVTTTVVPTTTIPDRPPTNCHDRHDCPPELPDTGVPLVYIFVIGTSLIITGALLLGWYDDE